jgi:hypothetical protein
MSAPIYILLATLLIIADIIRDEQGELHHADFNSFRRVNIRLYNRLYPKLWEDAAKQEVSTWRVFTHLLETNNLSRLKFFMDLAS